MHMTGVYERELRSVLAGERKGVIAITRSCTEIERARAMQVCQRPFLVVRAPGSVPKVLGIFSPLEEICACQLK